MRRTLHGSLRRRRNLTTISDVCEAAARSLFWAPNRFNELTEVRFFSFHPDCQIDSGFLTGQSWRVLKSWYTAGVPEHGFRRCFADGLDQSLVSSVAQADLVVGLTFTYI